MAQEGNIKDFYNDIAEEFADEWYQNESLLPTLKQFMSFLPEKPTILDIGCGAGYESMRLEKLGAKVVGIDYSEEPIRIARLRNPNCTFEIMDMRQINSRLGLFDGVVAIASLIHVHEDELADVFAGISKVTKPNGFLMICIVEGTGICPERSHVQVKEKAYDRTFYLHDKRELDKVAAESGFEAFSEIVLDAEVSKYGWKCFLYKHGNIQGL